jgi:hypothetical protein
VGKLSESQAERVVAIDPGKISGLSVVTVPSPTSSAILEESSELESAQLWERFALIIMNDPNIHVVAEKFTIGVATAKMSFQPWSLENIGAIRTIMHSRGIDPQSLHLQTASAAKALVTNDMLREVGLWHVGGAGHANDSLRHAVLFLVKHGWRPPGVLSGHDGDLLKD